MTVIDDRLDLPHFREAIRPYVRDVSPATFYRYLNGDLPPFARWLIARPDIAQALADDARALSEVQPDQN